MVVYVDGGVVDSDGVGGVGVACVTCIVDVGDAVGDSATDGVIGISVCGICVVVGGYIMFGGYAVVLVV